MDMKKLADEIIHIFPKEPVFAIQCVCDTGLACLELGWLSFGVF